MGILYKKCEVCGNKINKLGCLSNFKFDSEIECKKCRLKYDIFNIKFCLFLSNIIQTCYAIFCLFFSIGLSIYVKDNFDIHWLISVLVFVATWFLSSLFCMLLEWVILLLFVARFVISKDKKIDQNSSKFSNLINKAFNILRKN
ncbi:hypothetical protein [Campylobacter sp. CCUG 57310]|uniref:hypothetical protein n=1 Tax=Campylobacter sp. CCUG 57310 TaxID=2517362 RepID=UPI001565CC23|nr:hypothetical protein [Campylobacter sp. CCUG 57310]